MMEPQTNTHATVIEQIKNESTQFYGLATEVSKVIVGQQEVIEFILIACPHFKTHNFKRINRDNFLFHVSFLRIIKY